MTRAEEPDRPDPAIAADDATAAADDPTAQAASPEASANPADRAAKRERPRPVIRVVGTPPPPDAPVVPAGQALRALPITGLNRRRFAWALGIALSIWIVAVFARQVGEASAAAARADQVRSENAAMAAEVTALQHERDVVQERSFIEFQARAYGLGNAKDHPFTLSPNAPPLPSNAPGSSPLRLAADPTPPSPLDSWLSLLFGPGRT